MMMIPSQSCIFTLYLFFLVLLVLHTLASPTFQYCRHDQRDALLEFKHDFSVNESNLSPYNASLSSWNKSSDCCFWEGVTCDTKSGEVISLDLDFISLNTSLKPNSGLFKLQHLQNLSLGTCNLYGEIPSSLGNLSRLTRLDLSHNQLVGEVPSLVGNLNQLKELWLHTNSLSGNIPISFTNLTKLTVLVLSNNQFIGGDLNLILPNLTTLSFLNLAYNYFKSTLHSDMSGLRSLKFCNVGANSFFGPIPTSLFTIPLLEMLMLEQNQLEGPIEFRNMSSSFMLRYLKLCYNNFTGPLPKSIFGFVNLELLDLSSNKFIGPIPRSISKLLNLKFLRLSNNKLVGEVPSYLWGLEEVTLSQNSFGSFETLPQILNETLIQVLDLHSNSFREPFPYWICKFRSLKLIDFSNNLFSGSIPSCVRNFTHSLVVLRLRNNTLRGITPDIFANATYLKALDVSHNKLEGKLPKSLINCKAMQLLSVRSNKIKDTFPSWLGSLPSLHVLILSSNKFYGAVDHSPALTGFQSLKVMDISHNDFIGTLPPHLFSGWSNMTTLTVEDDKQDVRRTGNFTNMEGGYMFGDDFWTYFGFLYQNSMTLVYKGKDTEFERIRKDYCAIDFSENRFSGHIPESIGFLKALRFLNLSGNAFTSNIPQSLANLTMLEALDLSRNQLSGQIPQDLGSLAFLSTINFSHNNLQGLIPRGTQFQSQNCSSFMDNPKLDGLEELCDVSYPTPQQKEELSEGEEVINWIAAAIAYGPGVFCGLVIGHIFIASHKYEWFMEKFSRNKPKSQELFVKSNPFYKFSK